MKWNKFIQNYNDLTDRIFYYLYEIDQEGQRLDLFLFQHPYKISYIRYYYSYEIASNQINFQVDIKIAGKVVNSINIFFNKENNIRYSLREDDFFNRKTLSNMNVHKTIFLWTYFLMFSKVIEYKIGECL